MSREVSVGTKENVLWCQEREIFEQVLSNVERDSREKMTFAEKNFTFNENEKFLSGYYRVSDFGVEKVGEKRFKRMEEFEFGAENLKISTTVDFEEDKVTRQISQLVVKTDLFNSIFSPWMFVLNRFSDEFSEKYWTFQRPPAYLSK